MDPCIISTSTGATMVEVQIVGAGVLGLCAATEILDRGGKVALFDRFDAPGPHACSWWAGGMLAPFCEGESSEDVVVRLGKQAADWWRKAVGGVVGNGTLVLAQNRDQGELSRFAAMTEGHETVGADRIAELEPLLGKRFRKGLFYRNEAHLDPRRSLSVLATNLASKGVPIRTSEPNEDRTTLDCRGLAARDAIKDLRGVKGEMVILRCPGIRLNRPVRMLHPRFPVYVVPRDGEFMVGATMIESDERKRVSVRSVLELLSAAYALCPDFGEAEIMEFGVDSRPAFPDNAPRIARRGNTIFANGLYRHGFLLAPALARMLADLLFDGIQPEVTDESIV